MMVTSVLLTYSVQFHSIIPYKIWMTYSLEIMNLVGDIFNHTLIVPLESYLYRKRKQKQTQNEKKYEPSELLKAIKLVNDVKYHYLVLA